MKVFDIQHNIGKAKYVVKHHDGVKSHKDGSPFFDLSIFSNKKDLNVCVNKLKKDGYQEGVPLGFHAAKVGQFAQQ